MPPRYKNALAVKLALYTIIIALIVIAVGSMYEVRLQYQLVIRNTLDNAEQSLQLTTNAATEAVFQLDERLANEIVGSLMTNRSFLDVRIIDELGNTLAEANRPRTDLTGVNKAFELPPQELRRELIFTDGSGNSGSLVVVLDVSAGLESFFDTILITIAVVLLQVVGLSFIVFVVVVRRVTSPLSELAESFSRIDPTGSDRLTVPDNHKNDELGLLADSANRYLDSASRYHAEHATV